MHNPELLSRRLPAQGGMALIISLIMLTVMSIIAVHGIRASMMQERIASNVQQISLAEQAAEAALRAGEADIGGATLPMFNGSGGYYPGNTLGDPPRWTTLDWSQASARRSYTGFDADWPASATYFVEELEMGIAASVKQPPGKCKTKGCTAVEVTDFYRVVARGEAGGGQAVVVLETTFRRGVAGVGRVSWRRLR